MTSSNKGQKLPPEPLSTTDIGRLLQTCSTASNTGLRNKALIVMLYRTGLRISEALALAPKDVDFDTGAVRVLHGKGNRMRLVGLDQGTQDVLWAWLERREILGITAKTVIFCTTKGMSMSTSYVRNLLPRLAKKAGIAKRVHPHGLRHTHAFELASEGVPLHIIQAQLGHRNLATTDRYIRHLNPTAVIRAIQAREWDY